MISNKIGVFLLTVSIASFLTSFYYLDREVTSLNFEYIYIGSLGVSGLLFILGKDKIISWVDQFMESKFPIKK